MDILRLLDDLTERTVNLPKRTLMGYKYDKDEVAMLITKIRASLPNEVKAAAATLRESERIKDTAREDAHIAVEKAKQDADRIIVEANAEADRIIDQARIRQQSMLADSEILKLAKAQAEEIRTSADREAKQMRRGAETYALDLLSQLEGVIGKVMTTIERGKNDIQRPDTAVVASQPREKSRQ